MAAATQVSDIPDSGAPPPQSPLDTTISKGLQGLQLGTSNLNDPRIDPTKSPDQIGPQVSLNPGQQQQGTPLTDSDFELPKEPAQQTTTPAQTTPTPATKEPSPIATSTTTTQLPVSEGQKPLTEEDFKPTEKDSLQATIDQGNQDLITKLSQMPRDQIWQQFKLERDAGYEPDKNLYAQALQKQAQDELAKVSPGSPTEWEQQVQERATEAGKVAQQLASGTVKGISGLSDSINGLVNTAQSAANEANVAVNGVAGNPNASVELRGILEKNKPQMDPGEYQRQSDLILQLAGVENQIKQNDLAQLRTNTVEAQQLQNSNNLLMEQKKAIIGQINPDYSNYRQLQAQRNVVNGTAHGVAAGVDQLGRAATWIAYNSPTGIPLRIYDAHRDLQSWEDELEDHYSSQKMLDDLAAGKDITIKGSIPTIPQGEGPRPPESVSTPGYAIPSPEQAPEAWKVPPAEQAAPFQFNLSPGNLQEMQAHGYGPDPEKIRNVSDALQLAGTGLMPLDLGIGDAVAQRLLGGTSKFLAAGAERAVPLARKVAEVGPYDAIWSAIEAVPELAKGNLGKFAEKVGAAIGLPTGMYATTKVAQAAMKVGADFFANAASDSWKTGGFLPNMARRLTAEAINAPVESVTYAGLMSHDPEEFAQNVTTMAALRGGLALPKEGLGAFKNFWVDKYFGGAKNPPTPYQDYAPHAALDQNDLDKLNATSKETLASVPQDQQNAANSTRQFVGPEAQIHFAPTGEWDAYQKKYAPNSEGVSSRGFYIHDFPSQDLLTPAPRMIFVRGDSIPSALGWETGRLLHAVMPDDLKDRFDAAAAAGIKGGMDAFTQNYYRDLVGHGQGDLSQYPKFSDLPSEEDVANGADPGPNGYTKEMMFNAAGADTARRILNGQSISDLMKDPTLGRQIRQGLVWMIDKMGFPLSSDINPDTFDGINPGIPASIIMEQWMRKFGQRLTTYPLAEPQIGAGAASPGSRPPGTGPVGERPTPGPQPTPPMPVAGTPQGRTFTPSGEWQPHPGPNVVLPGGGGFQHRTRNGVLEVRWANPPNVQIQVPSTPAAVPPEQQKQKPTERTPAVTEGLPAPEPETPTAPQPLNREAVFDRIMQSEGRGSTEATEQGQHELYGFRDRDDPEAYQAIAQARAQYGVGSPEERAVVHQYLGNEFTQAGGEQFTNPAVQSLVASMAHMRGFRGARAMLQALVDGTLRKSYGELPKSTIDAINAMSPEEAIAKLRNVRERYDGLVYPNEWQQFKNGLRNRYDREANQALEIAGGSPNAYKVHSELARAQTYGAARGEEFEGPGGVRNPATGKAMTAEELEVHRLLMDPQTLREEASRGSPLARQLLEEQHGNTWMSELSPEQRSAYQANEPIDWQDQQRRLLAEGAYPQRRSATQVLGDQAQVLRQIQDAGGFSTAAKTWVEPNAEDIAEAHSAFMRLPPEYRQYMRQNFGITSNQLFNPGGTPLEEIPAKLGSGHPLQTGQDVLDHYYATLSNLDRMHRGLPALEYGQTPEVSQNVPREGTRNIQPLTAEAIQSARDAAAESVPTTTATGRARDTGSKAYQEEVETAKNEALLEAHAGSLEPGDDRVQLYRDPDTGKVSASGNQIVPGDLAHDLLTEGVDPAEIALANRFGDMARNREPVTMTYRSAARGHGEAASTERQVREEEQAASPAGQRAQGETAAEDLTKSWIPSRISISGLGKPGKKSILLHGLSTDKIAQNIAHIQEALPEGHPGKRLSKEDWAEAVSRYVENHQHGYSGDGSKALEGTEKIPVTPDTHYVAKPLGREVAQVINMAMADPSARGGSEKALAAREFARENEGYLSPEGEVNPLREEIDRTSQAYQTAQPLWHDKLTSPWETLRTDLVQDVHAGHGEGPGRMREGSEGLDQAISQYGMPRGQFVRAGFMPEGRAAFKGEGKPKPTQEELEARVGARLKAWNRQKDTVPMEVQRDEKGNIKTDKEGEPLFKQQDYGLQSAPQIQKLLKQKGGYEKAVNFLAQRLVNYAQDWIKDPRLKDAIGWYTEMTKTLQHSLGANMDVMGNLLAATSPGTGVVQNFLYALHALKLFGRGDYDGMMARFKDHIQNAQEQAAGATNEKGNPLTDLQRQALYRKLVRQFPEIPVREGGLKYGYNSPKVLHALAGVWEQLTEGPKISDFGKDLLGKADQAVIDRWAGRSARRSLYEGVVKRWRTNDAQESGVGKDYQFAQDAFHQAAAQMGMNNSDLQALLWYGEKQYHADRGWTRGAGSELGDFRRLSDELRNTDRYQLGLTNYTTPEGWDPEAHQRLIEQVQNTIRSTPGLLASRVMPGQGIFAGEGEPSIDAEFTVPKGTDISHIHQMVADLAREHGQHSAFVTRVHDEAGLEGSRPALEVGFKNPISADEARTLSGKLTDAGLGGMSLALDPYKNIVGFRSQSIPEFDSSIHPEGYEQAHEDWANNALKFENELRSAPDENVAYAYHRKADTTLYTRDKGYQASGPGQRAPAAFMPDIVGQGTGYEGEKIRSAAVRYPNGKVFSGVTHDAVEDNAGRQYAKMAVESGGPEYGFTTNQGRFVDRQEAWQIARSAKQFYKNATVFHPGSLNAENVNYRAKNIASERPNTPEGPEQMALFMPDEYRDADAGALTRPDERINMGPRVAFMPERATGGKDWDPEAVADLAARRRQSIRDAGRIPIEPHELAVRPSGTGWGLYDNGALSARYPTRAQAEDTRLFALEHGRQTPVAPNLQTQNIRDYLADQARRDAAERDAAAEYESETPSPISISPSGRPVVSTDVIPPISSERRTQLNNLWQDVSKQDEAFKFGIPKNGTPEAVAANYSTRSNPLKMTYRGDRDNPSGIRIENTRTGGYIDIKGLMGNKPYIEATEAESAGGKEGGGSQMYQAAFSWAAMNGVTLHGGSLTGINAMRRTSNMLSSALRHETTKQFTPGSSQYVNWVTSGEGYNIDTTGHPTARHTPQTAYEHNVAELARAESNMAHNRIPELGKIHYDFDKNVFLSDSDKPLTDTDIEETIKKRDPRFTEGVGLATAKRAIITASALEKRTGEPGEPVVPAIQPPRGPGSPFARILYHPETGAPVPRQQTGKFPTFVPLAHRKED